MISDFQFVPSKKDGLIVKLPPKLYSIEAKGVSYEGDRRIAGLRVIQKGVSGTRGKKIGKTWVDTGLTSVCEFERFSREWKALGKDAEEKLEEEYGKGADCGVFRLSKKGSPVLYASSGFGDGTFPVFELRDGTKRVGFEVEFITANQPYPFSQQRPVQLLKETEKEGAKILEAADAEFGKMLETLAKAKTGNRETDRERLKKAFDGFLGEMTINAQTEVQNLRQQILEVRRKAMPMQTKLLAAGEHSWLDGEGVRIRTDALKNAGFQEIGCFQSTAAPSLLRAGFIQESRGCMATVLKAGERAFLIIDYSFVDGSTEEFTDFASRVSRTVPPWITVVSRPDLSPGELIQLAEKTHKEGALKLLKPEDYACEAAAEWHRSAVWLAETGGDSSGYLKEVHRLTDSTEDREKLEWLRRDEADKSLCNWLRLQRDLRFDVDAVLDRLVIIHDDLTSSLLASAWWFGTNDLRVTEQDFAGSNPREVFSEVNRKRGNKLRLILEKRIGFPADYYLPAEA